MLKKVFLLSMALITGFSLLCFAGPSAEKKTDGSIFSYKKELGITDKQEKGLREIAAKLEAHLNEAKKKLDVLRADLSKMVLEKAGMDKIKVQLTMIAMTQVDASYEDIASARAMEEALTEAQLAKWHKMQSDFRSSASAGGGQKK